MYYEYGFQRPSYVKPPHDSSSHGNAHTIPPLLLESGFRRRKWQTTEMVSLPTVARMDNKLFALLL